MDTKVYNIPLSRIDPNPWQPRFSESEEHVKQLATSIAEQGLLQTPVGRLVDADGNPVATDWQPSVVEMKLHEGNNLRVQLAFGHSRLAAYKLLAESNPHVYSEMPVVLKVLTDENMFEMSISENLARKNLTPIEEAQAMRRYTTDFKKTSAQVGLLFGLGDSAVRNKMRLLALPPQIQAALGMGTITEGVARALLALYDLPAEWLRNRPDLGEIESLALQGQITPAGIYERVESIRGCFAPKMDLAPKVKVEVKTFTEAAPAPAPAWVETETEESDPDGPNVEDTQAANVDYDATAAERAGVNVSTETLKPTFDMGAAIQAAKVSTNGVPLSKMQVVMTITYMAGKIGERSCVVSVRIGNEPPEMRFTSEEQAGYQATMLFNETCNQYTLAHPEE